LLGNTLQPQSHAEIDGDRTGDGGPAGPGARQALKDDAMATRERRLADFDGQGDPPPDVAVQVLCEDKSGTYQLPFPCHFVDGIWRNARTGSDVEASVVGWRPLPPT
jgi:hypothetical protein